ncbi:MAG: DnaJ C-terminal domain-containing protein [Haloarculaceae archaeon]
MDDSMEDVFEQFFGGGEDEGDTPAPGTDLRTSLSVTSAEAREGTEKRLVIERPAVCQICGGSGTGTDSAFGSFGVCDACDGTGLYGPVERVVDLMVPAGTSDGQAFRVEGEGVPDPGGDGTDGDLYVEVSVADRTDGNGGDGDGEGFFSELTDEYGDGAGESDSSDSGDGDDEGAPRDLRTTMTIDLEDAFAGAEKRMTIARPATCPACDGTGGSAGAAGECTECGGDGLVREEVALTVQVPRGIEDGQTLRMDGEGIQNPDGPDSDLFVEVEVAGADPFTRDGADLYREVSVPRARLASGGTVEVEGIDGAIAVDLPPDASDGTVLEVERRGMPHLRRDGRGDLYVRIRAGGGDSGRPRSAGPPEGVPGAPIDSVAYGALSMGEQIASGGTAEVVRATVATADGEVTLAVKRPQLDGTLHAETVERVLDEAETWERLDDHDHVVGVVDYGDSPVPWIAMEYMDGGHLGDRAGEMPTDQAVWTAHAVARAVHHAHRRGVAHLDLKPENVIFRTVEGAWDVPKVADWGLSKHLLDRSGGAGGRSPSYAAPEQFDDEHGPTDDLTDVYQLGAVCFELFTGRPPFDGATPLGDRVGGPPPDPRAVADVPAEVADVVTTAMAPDRSDRYDSVVYVRDSLRDAYRSD